MTMCNCNNALSYRGWTVKVEHSELIKAIQKQIDDYDAREKHNIEIAKDSDDPVIYKIYYKDARFHRLVKEEYERHLAFQLRHGEARYLTIGDMKYFGLV